MQCCWSEGSKAILQLARIEFVEVDTFGANFILVDVTVVGPFRNILSRIFDAMAGEVIALDPMEPKH